MGENLEREINSVQSFIESNFVKTRTHMASEMQKLNERTDKVSANIDGFNSLMTSLQKSTSSDHEKFLEYKNRNAETFKYLHDQQDSLKTITDELTK